MISQSFVIIVLNKLIEKSEKLSRILIQKQKQKKWLFIFNKITKKKPCLMVEIVFVTLSRSQFIFKSKHLSII